MAVTEPDAEVLEQLSSDRAAKAMLEMILTTPDWIHRRSERVSFLDGSTTRRRTTVDLTVPFSAFEISPASSGVTYRLLLVDIAAKVPLVSFDIRNEAGEPIPVLSRTQNGILASSVLVRLAATVAAERDIDLTEAQVAALDLVACAPAHTAEEALAGLRTGELRDVFASTPTLDALAATLVDNFLLVAAVPAEVGERRIIKIAYDQQQEGVKEDRRRWWEKVAGVLGLAATMRNVPCGSLPDGESYHLEVDAPPQVEVVSAILVERPPGGLRGVDTDAVRKVPTTSGVHLNVSRAGDIDFDPDSLCGPQLQIGMRVRMSTWLLTALLTTSAVAVLLWGTRPFLERTTTPGTDPAALLAGIVALLLVLVNQPAEHPLSARLLGPARVGSLLSALLPLVAAWLLAFSGRADAQQWWIWLCWVSVALWIFTVLPFAARVTSWLGEQAPTQWSRVRRRSRAGKGTRRTVRG